MKNGVAAALLVIAILVGAGAGYLVGYANERTLTSVSTFIATSTSTTTFSSTSVETTTITVNTATTITGGSPIPIQSVETGNVSISGSPYTVAINPNASRIYVAGGSNTLTVIDAVSHVVVARVTLPNASSGIAIDYETGTVYVLVEGGIAVVNGTTNTVVKELSASFGYGSIAFDSSTGTLYGSPETISRPSSNSTGYLIGVDARTGAITANVSIGYWASDILVNPQLNLIYALGCAQFFVCGSTISVVNGTSAKLMKETALGSVYFPTAMIDEETGMVYASGYAELVELNPYGTVIYNYYPDTCGPFVSMADDPALNQVIVAPQNYNYILVYNSQFGNLLNMYSLPNSPQYVAFNPVTDETYVVVSQSLLTFKGVTSTGSVNDTLIGADQFCPLP